MQKLIKTTCRIAAKEIGKERAERIVVKAQRRYQELCLKNASDPKALRAHTFKRIYPAIAVYEALKEDGIDKKKAVWYIREYFQRFAASFVPHLQRVIRIFRLEKRIPALFMKISVKNFGTDAGFEYEFPENSGNEARFNIVHCPYYETCKRYDCPEITHVFCDGDDAGYGNLHPMLKWGRTKTIGRGGDCCDFLLKYTE